MKRKKQVLRAGKGDQTPRSVGSYGLPSFMCKTDGLALEACSELCSRLQQCLAGLLRNPGPQSPQPVGRAVARQCQAPLWH